jgi:hypothetical protein
VLTPGDQKLVDDAVASMERDQTARMKLAAQILAPRLQDKNLRKEVFYEASAAVGDDLTQWQVNAVLDALVGAFTKE